MSNDNYLTLLTMGSDSYYTAASAGAFNETVNVDNGDPHVTLAAFVAFILDGGYQLGTVDENSPPVEQWLWGNFDTTEKAGRGWSITTRPSVAGQLELLARCTAANGTVLEAAAPLTGAGLVSPFEQIIVAGLWYQGGVGDSTVCLTINGSFVAYANDLAAGGYLPSPFAARLGADPVVAADMGSRNVRFISCGYAPVPLTMTGVGLDDVGLFAGSTFRAFYSGYAQQSFLLLDNGWDWKHRYAVRSLAPGAAATVAKNATGQGYIPLTGIENENFAVPAAVMPDVGNQSPNPLFSVSPFTPVQLNLGVTGAGANEARLMGVKNTPYYAPPSFIYPTAP